MKLTAWLEANSLSHKDFGDRIGKSQAAVSRYAAGERMPNEEALISIFRETKGEVTPNDFVELPALSAAAGLEVSAVETVE